MIKKLTKEQEKQIPKYIEKYINLAHKKTDRKKSTLAVQALYKSAGEKKPIVIFGKSPFQTAIMVAMCKILFKEKLVKNGSQLYSQLYSQLRSQLDSQIGSINNDWWLVVWWLVWAGMYSFGKYIGVKYDNTVLKIFLDFVTNVSFIIPYKGIAFVSENPTNIKWDNQLLSSTKEPAIKYDSGGQDDLYFLEGVRFEKEWWEKIVNDTMTPDEIFAIDNIEHRRIAYEYMDKSKMKQLNDYKILDEQVDDKGNQMKIISFTVQNMDEPLKFYNCICPSTKREYFVGTDKNNCLEAKNSSFGLEGEVEWVNEW